jgi:hypothetical protein
MVKLIRKEIFMVKEKEKGCKKKGELMFFSDIRNFEIR